MAQIAGRDPVDDVARPARSGIDAGGDVMRSDRARRQAALFAPGKEPGAGPGISAAGIGVGMLAVKNSTQRQAASSPRSAHDLCGLDDHILQDIGLT